MTIDSEKILGNMKVMIEMVESNRLLIEENERQTKSMEELIQKNKTLIDEFNSSIAKNKEIISDRDILIKQLRKENDSFLKKGYSSPTTYKE